MTELVDLRQYLNQEIIGDYLQERLPGLKDSPLQDFLIFSREKGMGQDKGAAARKQFVEQLQRAGSLLRKGELVAFPTETVYGLGASALKPEAINKIFQAKGRPQDNPLIIHIVEEGQLERLVAKMPPSAYNLAEKFWPGPLTLVLEKEDGVPGEVTAGLPSVAVRMPAHPLALALIHECGEPLAAPSANISGRPSPTRAEHVHKDLAGQIAMIIDGGPCPVGLESTVIDCTREPHVLLRPGGLPLEILQGEIPGLELDPSLRPGGQAEKALAPGMKYRHYSPGVPVFLYEGKEELLQEHLKKSVRAGEKTGLLVHDKGKWGKWIKENLVEERLIILKSLSGYSLFSRLRELDLAGAESILIEGVGQEGLGLTIMNRLRKAATKIYS
ncbi:MAG: L-threonylcarbamoyladenylate synthase [Halanaerobium sp.]|nr:L-threonylcarbamoyladenylate synthase [Halanaerobium sp.]